MGVNLQVRFLTLGVKIENLDLYKYNLQYIVVYYWMNEWMNEWMKNEYLFFLNERDTFMNEKRITR